MRSQIPDNWHRVVYNSDQGSVATYLTLPSIEVGQVVTLTHPYLGYQEWRVVNRKCDEWCLLPAALTK